MNAFEKKINRLLFTGSSRIEMYETIALLLENGVILSKALRDLYMIESKNGKKKKEVRAVVLNEMMNGVAAGQSLSAILADWAPPQEVALIQAGEVSSRLPQSLMECSKIITAKQEIVGAIIAGISYPILIFILIVVLLHQVATKMVPQFARVSPPETWTGSAAVLNHLSYFVTNWGLESLGVLFIFLMWVVWSMPNMHRPRIRIYLDKIPPWSIYRMLQGSTFLLNIAIMIKAGVRLQNILIMMAKTGSPWVRSRVGAALAGINSGLNLGQALHRTGYQDRKSTRLNSSH